MQDHCLSSNMTKKIQVSRPVCSATAAGRVLGPLRALYGDPLKALYGDPLKALFGDPLRAPMVSLILCSEVPDTANVNRSADKNLLQHQISTA